MRNGWRKINRWIRLWANSEDGPTATEYAVLLALIVVVSVGVIGSIGGRIAGLYAIIVAGLPEGFLS
ncbi:MAG TPA: Flp family type IVb pilin [Phycisphaerae bacterium]|jgi:Flp pilus assembly pilin Flp|nr:Flp family type IVb pilin [Phycisphaerae bacterium]HOB75495.1 Flp family type IVb pilin [Phycisphaerae bacterium]HOJ55281.1 Flp family type IVb pilin [Phycisphaerae bacterium]HOL27431.1 Flp family type IVb pilin [Phycisphaerae bacterium]HPP21584.1 Flp family type IVb pilin [Phycisphaerae bacterium]